MRWYLITIPFITIFLFIGFKLDVYHDQGNTINYTSENALYDATNINKLRTFEDNIIDQEDLIINLIKYITVQPNYSLDYNISYQIISQTPLIIDIIIETTHKGETMTISKTFIMDSTI